MTPESVVDIFRQAVSVTVLLVSFLVMPGLVVGLIIAMFQAATQINEMSLTFVPKLFVTLLAIVYMGPKLLTIMMEYSQQLIHDIPNMIG